MEDVISKILRQTRKKKKLTVNVIFISFKQEITVKYTTKHTFFEIPVPFDLQNHYLSVTFFIDYR